MQGTATILKWLFGIASATPLFAYLLCMAMGAKRKLTNREMLFLFAMAFGLGLVLWLLDLTSVAVDNYLTRL